MAGWNISIFIRKYIFKGSIFHRYVSLPECTSKESYYSHVGTLPNRPPLSPESKLLRSATTQQRPHVHFVPGLGGILSRFVLGGFPGSGRESHFMEYEMYIYLSNYIYMYICCISIYLYMLHVYICIICIHIYNIFACI